ncbi:MarR family transcriptional regulator [Sphingomonas sp. ID1715]|uniref:MarR family winged helix-turn-helix transcriptional regulator n=1 Tax=Sphingomonas sp. ID1715 TaxID=1656898 RepID=UPI00148959D8|nr:MarR family transcriptional regulator [Sphingomonas sp. ID1715]NNM78362.1 MarR family transcriptional regulator [Sphingomonas sp. ID1715]
MADQIGFLTGDVSRLLRRAFDVRAREIGVTRTQWRMLTTLSRNEGANQGQLAELLDIEPITLCRLVDKLSAAGLVERRPDPADRRAWRIYLSEAAHPIIARLRLLADSLLDEVLAGMDEGERAHLAELLGRMRDNLVAAERNERKTAHG